MVTEKQMRCLIWNTLDENSVFLPDHIEILKENIIVDVFEQLFCLLQRFNFTFTRKNGEIGKRSENIGR